MNNLIDDVRQAQREALRQANLLPEIRARVEAIAVRRTLSLHRPGLWMTAAAVGVAAAAVFLLRPVPLSIVIGDPPHPGLVGALVEAPSGAPLPMRFGDGTALALAPRARLAVAAVNAHGATLVLERGRLGVGVVHRPGARWLVRAGQFEVAVTGTQFDVSFDPETDALTVEMRAGSVIVRGPGLPAATALGAGQTLRAVGRERHFDIASRATSAPSAPAFVEAAPAPQPAAPPQEAPAPAELPPAAPAAPALHLAPPRGVRAADRADRSWSDLAAASRYQEALAAAQHAGFGGLCNRLDAAGLVLLGDVARWAGDPARAQEAYLTARRRFPRLDRPLFAMGLMAFEQRRRFHEAATWFESYLESYPRGPLAREAAGRLVESWQRAGETAEAQRAARAYLETYPSGPHAALARQIAGP